MMSVNDIQLRYGEKIVIENLSFTISSGEIIGVLGKNGTGKTTLLKSIVGLKDYTSGSIAFSLSEDNIGFLPEVADCYEYLTGMEFLEVLSDIKGFSKEKLLELLSWMESYINMPDLRVIMSNLSKGNLEKVMFIQSFLNYPKILVLDEPFTGFDTKSIIGAKKMLMEYAKKGNAIILSTHIIEMCSQLCNKIVLLSSYDDYEIITLEQERSLEETIMLLEEKLN